MAKREEFSDRRDDWYYVDASVLKSLIDILDDDRICFEVLSVKSTAAEPLFVVYLKTCVCHISVIWNRKFVFLFIQIIA